MSVLKLAAQYLTALGPGGVFTIEQIERYVTEQTGKRRVECDRRVRDLRAYRWVIDSYREDRSLRPDQHRVVRIGDDVTHPGCRRATQGCPSLLYKQLFLRDGKRCVICGIGAGEEYPDQPGSRARLTIGRILPGSRGGVYSLGNCRVECSRCNEHNRDTYWGQERAA